MKTKGIILAGGNGVRLYPLSKIYSKQLIAVYDKQMIYYPFATIIAAGISDILIISDENTLHFYQKLFNDGKNLGLSIEYAIQKKPNGIAEAFIIGKNFIANDNVALILGDNIFYGSNEIFFNAINSFQNKNPNSDKNPNNINNNLNNINNNLNNINGIIFALYVNEPERYGVVKFDSNGQPIEIIEKPKNYISNYAIPGFYIYDSSVVEVAENLKPSNRNELEITDVNNFYLKKNQLDVIKLSTGITWLDCGTPNSLLNASNFVASIEERHGLKLGCPEEESLKMNFINKNQLLDYANDLPDCNYRNYLIKIANSK